MRKDIVELMADLLEAGVNVRVCQGRVVHDASDRALASEIAQEQRMIARWVLDEEFRRSRASALLNRRCVRLMRIHGLSAVGVWSDQDGAGVRLAMKIMEIDDLPLIFLDGDADIPAKYRAMATPTRSRRGLSWETVGDRSEYFRSLPSSYHS